MGATLRPAGRGVRTGQSTLKHTAPFGLQCGTRTEASQKDRRLAGATYYRLVLLRLAFHHQTPIDRLAVDQPA